MLPRLAKNQKAIRIAKAQSDKNNTYTIFNFAATRKAMKELTPNAFKLWCYFNSNANGYEFGLSSKEVCEECGMSRNTYDKAVHILIDAGYLIQVELYENITGYLFIENGYGGEVVKEEDW